MRSVLSLSPIVFAAMLMGCPNDDTVDTTVPDDTFCKDNPDCLCTDVDEDSFCAEVESDRPDCDDGDPAVHPGAVELCNGVDDNCNGLADDGLPDADGDGICNGLDSEDCDGVDNDGDGEIDEGFPDADLDGTPDCRDVEECDGVDNDGDGEIDENFDLDGDSFTTCPDADEQDCDDEDAAVYPGATENTADSRDNDCDGLVDESGYAPGDLIITEIMSNPGAVSDPQGEWFEVYNASGSSIYLNGLWLRDAHGESHHVLSDELIVVANGDYAVLGLNADGSSNGGVYLDYEYSQFTLENEVDSLQLWAEDWVGSTLDAVMLDQVAWDDGATFPDPNAASMSLEPIWVDAAINDDGAYWCSSTVSWNLIGDFGSPGEANEPCSTFDHDGDGFSVADGDCNDLDDTVYPGAPESDSSVDNDCDGVVETAPVAVASLGTGSGDEQCSDIYLSAASSYDPDGNTPLTYLWELVSAPTGSAISTADIVAGTSSLASFEPDVAGTYTFALTVWDSGAAASLPTSIEVDVDSRSSNSTPTADAGSSQTSSATSECTPVSYGASYECSSCDDKSYVLNGTGSSDGDADTLYYAWSLSTSTVASISGAGTATPTVTISSPNATYGSTATNSVLVTLRVTDCMGATSAGDSIALSYSCTGE